MDDKRYAVFKRLLETWQVDPAFREEVKDGVPGLFPSGEEEPMRKAILATVGKESIDIMQNPYTAAYVERFRSAYSYMEESFSPSSYHSKALQGYAERTRNRCWMESRTLRMQSAFFYPPMVTELSRGCRLGCDFCGLAAEKWTANAPYDREQWRQMIRASLELIGPVAGDCLCYYATEPMDHPDYERFITDQAEITGRFPQTTTAAPDRDPERTRRLMELLGPERLREQCRLRFSIRSIAHFHRIAKLFSPEELVNVELLANNRESLMPISNSGRTRDKAGTRLKLRYSISCVSGLRVNLVDRTMAFIEPILPSETWPCGYQVLETTAFENAEDYREKMAALYARYALAQLPLDRPVRIHPEVRVLNREGQIWLVGDGVEFRTEDNPQTAQALNRLREGAAPNALLQEMQLSQNASEEMGKLLNSMFEEGYLILK